MNAIEIKNISHSFNGAKILNNISLNIEKGDFFAIAGPNGVGKSTLLKIINGSLKKQCGEVKIFGRFLEDYSPRALAQKTAVVLAETFVPYEFSVYDIVSMGRWPHQKWWKDYNEKDRCITEEVIAETGIEHLKDRSLNSLSSGERQKVFIAQGLCQKPEILILDEPASHLDIKHQLEIFSLLLRLRKKNNITVLVVSHNINLLAGFADKIALMKTRHIHSLGAPKEVITQKNILDVYGVNSEIIERPSRPPFVCMNLG